jgi:hypothetical protein
VGVSYDAMDPDLRQAMMEFMGWIGSQRAVLTITSTVRSMKDQKFLWDRYQKGQSILPAAPPGHSAHEYGWAFDAVVSPAAYQMEIGAIWEKYWGGKFGGKKDPVHFELPGASQLAWQIGEQGQPTAAGKTRTPPPEGGAFYQLADFLSGFVPGIGELQLVNGLVTLFDGHTDIATWYLDHPAEAVRDLVEHFL